MELKTNEVYHGFKLLEKKVISEIQSEGFYFEHIQSGARLFKLANQDDNKAFSIAFQTFPADDTGVAHILEHSVLNGSRNFPAKEPFAEMIKKSLKTFINAMTYGDKTIYPVSSKNDQDFRNLMHVYLDAVFYPLLLDDPMKLMQEGWHYELNSKEDPLRISGVVYNEMKGSYSSPKRILYDKMFQELFPDTIYRYSSGGDPEAIPDLTQKQFTDFHRLYYHPSNSYIYLYGNGKLMDELQFISENYLNHFQQQKPITPYIPQKPFLQMKELTEYYPVLKSDSIENKTWLNLSYVFGRSPDPLLYYSLSILNRILTESEAGPLKTALNKSGIGGEVSGVLENDSYQYLFGVTIDKSNPDRKNEFLSTILSTLKQLADQGIDPELIESSINAEEFNIREGDIHGISRALIYCFVHYAGMIHGNNPFMHLEFNQIFKEIREKSKNGYFENLIRTLILENKHSLLLTLSPKPGLTEEKENILSKKLDDLKKSLTPKELDKIIEDSRRLKDMQTTPDSREVLDQIPMLSLTDLPKNPRKIPLTVTGLSDNGVLFTNDMDTGGISYLRFYFPLEHLGPDELQLAGLLIHLLRKVDTQELDYRSLSNRISRYTGGVHFGIRSYDQRDTREFRTYFTVKAKCLNPYLPETTGLIRNIITGSLFTDKNRLSDLFKETVSGIESMFNSSGNLVAVRRALSSLSIEGVIEEKLFGIDFYRFLKNLNPADCINHLTALLPKIFSRGGIRAGIATDSEGLKNAVPLTNELIDLLPSVNKSPKEFQPELNQSDEAFILPSGQVQYNARVFDYRNTGFTWTGKLRVLSHILTWEHLMNRVRVQGGAYGVGISLNRNGYGEFASYRDPALSETYRVFDEIGDYLSGFQSDEKEMTGYIIGTISRMDSYLSNEQKAMKSDARRLSGLNDEDETREWNEVIHTSVRDIQSFAKIFKSLGKTPICTIGSQSRIEAEKGLFSRVEQLIE